LNGEQCELCHLPHSEMTTSAIRKFARYVATEKAFLRLRERKASAPPGLWDVLSCEGPRGQQKIGQQSAQQVGKHREDIQEVEQQWHVQQMQLPQEFPALAVQAAAAYGAAAGRRPVSLGHGSEKVIARYAF
jgi:hypothetical protein